MTATEHTRIPRPLAPRWGVVCSDGDVVWAKDEAAARRLLTSLVGASRIVRQEAAEYRGVTVAAPPATRRS